MAGRGDGLGNIQQGAVSALEQIDPVNRHPLDVNRDDLALRFRGWYLMAINHPLWANFITEAAEDEGYYIGGERQWSKNGSLEALHYLRGLTPPRTTVSINHVRAVVNLLAGYETQNRSDIKASPQGDEDAESARILSWLLKFQQDQMDLQEHEGEGFKAGLIRGASAFDVVIDFTDDSSLNGKITVDVLRPGEDVIWDPYAKKYDLSDARFVLKYSWAYVDDVVEQFPEFAAAIRSAIDIISPATQGSSESGPPSDAYGSVLDPQTDMLGTWQHFYDPRDRRVLLIEGWFRHFEPVWLAVN